MFKMSITTSHKLIVILPMKHESNRLANRLVDANFVYSTGVIAIKRP